MSARLLSLALIALAFPPVALEAQRLSEVELVWPLPPEAPRVRYVGWVSTEADIGKSEGLFSKMRNRLAGTASAVLGLQRPHDVYVDAGGRFFVSDGARGKVVLFNTDTRSALVLGTGGEGSLRKPLGLGGDGRGTVYVADASAARVVAFDRDGLFLRAYGGEQVLLNPADVAVDPDRDRLYVVDSYLHQVIVFSIASGEVVQRIGRDVESLAEKRETLAGMWEREPHGQAPTAPSDQPASHAGTQPGDLVGNRGGEAGEFRYPAFLAVGPDGTLYVCDQMNFRVQAFAPDGSFLRQIGRIGRAPGSFSRPKGIGVDTRGHLYVVDALFNNIQVFDPEGRLLLVFGKVGSAEGELYMPLGLQVDALDRIYVADRFNDRIQVFEFLGPEAVAGGSGGERR